MGYAEEGLELKIARLRAHIKQYELAAKLGIPGSQLCDIEAGRRSISPDLAEKIQTALHEAHKVKA